ncbi:MAG: excalibur calcium-binding domain-containing protein [Actinomycetota bacterium]
MTPSGPGPLFAPPRTVSSSEVEGLFDAPMVDVLVRSSSTGTSLPADGPPGHGAFDAPIAAEITAIPAAVPSAGGEAATTQLGVVPVMAGNGMDDDPIWGPYVPEAAPRSAGAVDRWRVTTAAGVVVVVLLAMSTLVLRARAGEQRVELAVPGAAAGGAAAPVPSGADTTIGLIGPRETSELPVITGRPLTSTPPAGPVAVPAASDTTAEVSAPSTTAPGEAVESSDGGSIGARPIPTAASGSTTATVGVSSAPSGSTSTSGISRLLTTPDAPPKAGNPADQPVSLPTTTARAAATTTTTTTAPTSTTSRPRRTTAANRPRSTTTASSVPSSSPSTSALNDASTTSTTADLTSTTSTVVDQIDSTTTALDDGSTETTVASSTTVTGIDEQDASSRPLETTTSTAAAEDGTTDGSDTSSTTSPAPADGSDHSTSTTAPAGEDSGTSDGGDPDEREPAGSGGPYYPDCTAAQLAGAAPLATGSPGYRAGLDPDGDGVACGQG